MHLVLSFQNYVEDKIFLLQWQCIMAFKFEMGISVIFNQFLCKIHDLKCVMKNHHLYRKVVM